MKRVISRLNWNFRLISLWNFFLIINIMIQPYSVLFVFFILTNIINDSDPCLEIPLIVNGIPFWVTAPEGNTLNRLVLINVISDLKRFLKSTEHSTITLCFSFLFQAFKYLPFFNKDYWNQIFELLFTWLEKYYYDLS